MLAFKLVFKQLYLLVTSRRYREFVWLSFRYGSVARYSKKRISFSKYTFDVPDPLSFVWQFKEIFVDEYYNFPSDKTTPLIIDCGANIGTSCIYFKDLYPYSKIKAFEANPQMARILSSNLQKNGISDVQVINKAVWIHGDGIEISIEGSDASSMFSEEDKSKVPSVRLKEVIDAAEQEVDMLKIDIEGAETEVLKDCGNSIGKVRNIFIEYHSFTGHQQNLQDILRILSENNFRYFMLSAVDRTKPLVNRISKNNTVMDFQINIFGYQTT